MRVGLGFDRDLDLPALRKLVSEIGADPSMWRELVNLDAEHRHYAQLWRDDHVDIWVISWMNGHDTGFHDHDLSSGAVAVVEGELIEERMALGGPPRRRAYAAGETFEFDASHVHRMHQANGGPAVSIHAYSPPLWRMGTYLIEPDGTLRRTSISYAEELRPADAAAAVAGDPYRAISSSRPRVVSTTAAAEASASSGSSVARTAS